MGSLPVVTYKSVGKTIPDALQRMLSMAPRMPYLSHVRVLVFGEDLARLESATCSIISPGIISFERISSCSLPKRESL